MVPFEKREARFEIAIFWVPISEPSRMDREETMHLKFEAFDGRGRNYRSVIDEDTGKEVGYIRSNGVGMYSGGGIQVSLFDDKYCITVSRYEECLGFIKGVEAVLRHMVSIQDRSAAKREAA